jgi:hypothetical protein
MISCGFAAPVSEGNTKSHENARKKRETEKHLQFKFTQVFLCAGVRHSAPPLRQALWRSQHAVTIGLTAGAPLF